MKIKVIIAVVMLVPALAHLFYAFTRSTLTNYYLTVDELLAQEGARDRQAVRLGGQVVPGTIQWDNPSRTLRFRLAGQSQDIAVVYRGFSPDAFRDGVTAIVEGEYTGRGVFVAYKLMIKCPHQYLPAL